MPSLRIELDIPAEKYLRWYRGTAKEVMATSEDGRRVQFPASCLQRFVSPDGVHGTFVLTYDENFKFVSIEKLGSEAGFDRYV